MQYETWAELQRAAERLSPERMKAAVAIVECLAYLGPQALELLVDEAQGLRVGALQYGDWGDDDRNMATMAREEARDGAVYARRKMVQTKRELARWEELHETFARAHGQARELERNVGT